MTKHFIPKTLILIAILSALPAAHAANLAQSEYNEAKVRINAEFKTDKTACDTLAGNTKDVCIEEAKAKQKVAQAELEFSHSGKVEDQNKVGVAKAEAAYAIAKEKCDDKAGNAKDICVQEAKAIETKALVDAKLGKQIGAAKVDAADDKRDADYKVAVEKCDALSGDAKANCITAAKTKFGKR